MSSEPVAKQHPATSRSGCAGWFIRDGRLRSGWRVTGYMIASRIADLAGQLALGMGLAIIVAMPLAQSGVPTPEIVERITGLFRDLFDHPLLALSFGAERVILVLVVVWLFRRFIDRRSFASLGFRRVPGWWSQIALGLAFSIGGWAVIFASSLALGATTVTGFGWNSQDWAGVFGGLALGLVLNLLVGVAEETDARGYVLQNLAEGIRLGPAILISSLYFALLHLLNPGAGLTSTIGIFVAGILLALGYYATGQLWFSIGMHAGWNFAEGPLFGFLVSGLKMGGLVHIEVTGPDWLMGGAFGPEAGVLSVFVEIIMILVLFWWGRRNMQRDPGAITAAPAIGEKREAA